MKENSGMLGMFNIFFMIIMILISIALGLFNIPLDYASIGKPVHKMIRIAVPSSHDNYKWKDYLNNTYLQKQIGLEVVWIPYEKHKGNMSEFLLLAERENVDFVVEEFGGESSQIELSKLSTPVQIITHPTETLITVYYKNQLSKFLTENGFEEYTPEVYPVNVDPEDLIFPIVVKPYRGYGGNGQRIIKSSKEFKELSETDLSAHYLSEFIHGHKEESLYFIFDGEDFIHTKTRHIIFNESLHINGNSAWKREIYWGEDNPKVVEIGRKILKKIFFSGQGCFDYKVDNDKVPKIWELNPRLCGGLRTFDLEFTAKWIQTWLKLKI